MIQDLITYKTPEGFRGRSLFVVQLWEIIYSLFFKRSPRFMFGWRRFLLRSFGAKIGKNVLIRPSAKITYPWKVTIGESSWVGDNTVLYSLGEIQIGSNTVISQRCYLCTASHKYDDSSFPIYSKKITIGAECWLATDVYVAPGVSIKNASVVGARSSVFSNLDSKKIYIGSPAKYLKER
jgi:putative colanic acid biosynthesis acetyltransferase WcaF